jgi:hypothetical protein
VVTAAALLCGCNQLFGLETTNAIDAPVDLPPCVPITASAPPTLTRSISVDGLFVDSRFASVLDGRAPTRALWLFDLPIETINRELTGLRIAMPYVSASGACGTPCGSCTRHERPGELQLYPLFLDWDATANWDCKTEAGPCVQWPESGAGGSARGPRIATVQHEPMTASTFVVSDIATAFSLAPDRQVAFVAQAAREDATGAGFVTGGYGVDCGQTDRLQLELDYCP